MSVMQLPVRRFVLRTRTDDERLYAFLRANVVPMREAERFVQAIVSEYRQNRSNEQNAYMWAGILQPVSEQACIGGHRYSPEVWNIHFKREHLPEVNAKGQQKWVLLPSGERELAMSTTDLNVAEMADYLNEIAAAAATELGVHLPISPNAI